MEAEWQGWREANEVTALVVREERERGGRESLC